jgi:uncharacterized membrane protein YfcA
MYQEAAEKRTISLRAPLRCRGTLAYYAAMEPWAVLLVLAVVLVASIAQTVTGFGFALIAVPFLVTALDVKDVVVLVGLLGLANSLLVARTALDDVPMRTVATMLGATFAGFPFGLAVLLLAPADALRIGVAVASIVMAAALASGVSLGARGTAGELVAGVTSGVLNTSTGMNGPPIVIYLQDAGLPPREFRAALAAFFSVSGFVSTGVFAVSGVITHTALGLAAAGLPAVFTGSWLGHHLFSRIDHGLFRRLVLGLLAATAMAAIGTSLARILD